MFCHSAIKSISSMVRTKPCIFSSDLITLNDEWKARGAKLSLNQRRKSTFSKTNLVNMYKQIKMKYTIQQLFKKINGDL